MSWGLSFWVAFIVAVALSFVLGVLIERVILRPLHNAPVLSIIVVFIGLLAIFNSMAGRDLELPDQGIPLAVPQERASASPASSARTSSASCWSR